MIRALYKYTCYVCYAPNVDDKQFYDHIQDLLEDSVGTLVI